MKNKHLAVFALFLIITCSISPLAVYAEEEEEDEEGSGFGVQERERERQEGSSPFSGAILYVTIGAIIAAVGYTVFKIVRSRRETKKLQ